MPRGTPTHDPRDPNAVREACYKALLAEVHWQRGMNPALHPNDVIAALVRLTKTMLRDCHPDERSLVQAIAVSDMLKED